MASAAHICSICDLRHVTKPSEAWCSECDEGFCSGCVEHHSLAKATRHHKTMTIADYHKLPADVLQIPRSCTKHDEKFLLYCTDHEMPCCGKCINEGHKGCNEVINLDDVIKNAKTSSSFHEIEETLAEIVENIQKLRKFHGDSLSRISENRIEIEKKIQEIRLKVNNHLDQIQRKLMQDMNIAEVKERAHILETIHVLKEKEDYITVFKEKIDSVKQYASDLQTFLTMKDIEKDIIQENNFCQSFTQDDTIAFNVIDCNINEQIRTIMTNMKRFGEIVVKTRSYNILLSRKKKRQAQMLTPIDQQRTLNNLKVQLQNTINIDAKDVRGCCLLPDGRVVILCFLKKKVTFIKHNGSTDFEMVFPSVASLAYIKSANIIAIACNANEKCIRFIDIEDMREKKSVSVRYDSAIYGIVESNGSLIISVTGSGLKTMNLKDESITDVVSDKIPSFTYVDTYQNKLYFTNFIKGTVTCCDLLGRIQWKFEDKNILKTPFGISLDNDGNVFVVGGDSCNIVVITPDGQHCRELLSAKDGLLMPQVLHVERTSNTLLVANSKNKVFIYKLIK